MYLNLNFLTTSKINSNVCSETTGNGKTLQTIRSGPNIHTVVPAWSIRWAIRNLLCQFEEEGIGGDINMFRKHLVADAVDPSNAYVYQTDKGVVDNPDTALKASLFQANTGKGQDVVTLPDMYTDLDLFGYMYTQKGATNISRKGAVDVTHAVSLSPFFGDTAFMRGTFLKKDDTSAEQDQKDTGDTDDTSATSTNVLTRSEWHKTRYQFSLSVNLRRVRRESVKSLIEVLAQCVLPVGGGQSAGSFAMEWDKVAWQISSTPITGDLWRATPDGDAVVDERAVLRRVSNKEDLPIEDGIRSTFDKLRADLEAVPDSEFNHISEEVQAHTREVIEAMVTAAKNPKKGKKGK